jgi:hypothetical protein
MAFLCLYRGVPGDCQECGFHDPTGTGFCSHDCRDRQAQRVAAIEAARQRRRDEEEAFGREADRLRAAGHGDEEIDVLLARMP